MKYKITSDPVYDETEQGKLRIGIPHDWTKFYVCEYPNLPIRYGASDYSQGKCNLVFRYERQIKDHIATRHHDASFKREHLTVYKRVNEQ